VRLNVKTDFTLDGKSRLLIAVLLFRFIMLQAQQTVPVFANKKDSTDYAQVQSSLQEIWRTNINPVERKKYDSLLQLHTTLRSKIIGYRVIYSPNRTFTPIEDILLGKKEADSVKSLSISGKEIKKVPNLVFNCINLEELELVNTSIRKLPTKLNKLPHLKSLFVFNNKINKPLKLGKNKNIRELIFRGVEAEALPRTYKSFRGMQDLDLTGNIRLSKFPNITKNSALKKLSLIGNQIILTDIPDQNFALEYLNLMSNKISILPETINRFPKLQRLILSNNPISSIDPAIGTLTNLEELSFYNCKLSSLPVSMESLYNLKQIDLYFNNLTSINIDLSKLSRLEILYLSHNQLSALPENIGKLPNLRELYISNNKLSYLPESMRDLSALKVLRINNNYFTSFPYPIVNLENLENLDVSHNDLHEIPEEIISFNHLQIFALVDNPWENKDGILKLAEALRAKGTIVHLNTLEASIDGR
jgi:Leucine-rich repeat (LRR) protein